MKEAFIFYTLNPFGRDAQYSSLVPSPWLVSYTLSVRLELEMESPGKPLPQLA